MLQLLREHPDMSNIHPLSYGQKALWFLWELDPLSSAYNQIFTARICSYLNLTNLVLAFGELVKRHPSLCSTFPKLGEEPIQQIHQDKKPDIKQIDVSQMNDTELYSSVYQESQRPFNLKQESPIRVRLFTCSQKEHILLMTIHHIVTDGWSLGIILNELKEIYEAQQNSISVSLPTLKHSYSDYVCFQKQMLEGCEGEKLWSYWQDKLKGELPVLNLPVDKPRPPIQTYNGASYNFELSFQLTEKLKHLAILSDATLYMTLLAAFDVLLYRYTGQSDILVGSPTAGRLQSEFRGIVGYFANPVVLRVDLSNDPSFDSFLKQVRQTVSEALIHQDYPFILLVEKLHLQHDSSRSPIFQTSLTLHQLKQFHEIQRLFANKEGIDWGGLKLRPFEIPQQEGQFDLDLQIIEGNSSIFGSWKYNTDLFDRSTIARMACHFQNILEAIVENPQRKVSEIPLLSQAEREQLLIDWNDTDTDYPQNKFIHELFEEQVTRTPEAVAVVFESEELTYSELNTRSNQLAHYLRSLGVGAEVLVGICVERSMEMMVGLLGILKAGGAYVPLDPNYPKERLSYMLCDSGVEVLLSQESLLESLPRIGREVICLDRDWQRIEHESSNSLNIELRSDNLAYVIYTSGSTGEPKGVQICHQSVVNFLNSMSNYPGLTQEDIFYAITTISFDIAGLELYLPLIVGAKLIIGAREISNNSDLLLSELLESKVSVMQATPSTWQILLAGGWSSDYPLKVLCGGEALSVQLASQILETNSELWNLYGPTEATVWSTIYQVGAKTTVTGNEYGYSSIGRPINNTEIYILDRNLQLVPVGVPGELYIGGAGLGRGYLNRPELSQERFVANPFKNGCLYKTGDLTRYMPDGNIEFLGRVDHQVKIRGFRIELGEIEFVLNTHREVKSCVVVADENISDNRRLIAYVVTESESLSSSQLREKLKRKLPSYMVPSAFVFLDALPLTPNGKVNRFALPKSDEGISREGEYIPPSTPTQEIIANIFAQTLGLESVGIHDNFFDLGGHSLLATQVISRLQQIFELNVSLRSFFEKSTVAKLSQIIGEKGSFLAEQLQSNSIDKSEKREEIKL